MSMNEIQYYAHFTAKSKEYRSCNMQTSEQDCISIAIPSEKMRGTYEPYPAYSLVESEEGNTVAALTDEILNNRNTYGYNLQNHVEKLLSITFNLNGETRNETVEECFKLLATGALIKDGEFVLEIGEALIDISKAKIEEIATTINTYITSIRILKKALKNKIANAISFGDFDLFTEEVKLGKKKLKLPQEALVIDLTVTA